MTRALLRKAALALPSPLVCLALPASCLAVSFVSTQLSHYMHGLMPLVLGGAIVLTTLIRQPVRTWPVLAFLAAGAELTERLAGGIYIGTAVMDTALYAIAPLLIATGLRRVSDGKPWYTSGRWFYWFAILAFFVSAFDAVVGAGWYAFVLRVLPFGPTWMDWFASDLLGFLIATPFLMSWSEPALRRDLTVSRVAEAGLLAVLVAAVSYFAFTINLPLLFIIFPCLALITLRGGLPGATAGSLAFAAVTIWFQVEGRGPIATLPGINMFGMSLILQAYFLTAALSTIPVAVILTLRAALTDRLRQQDAISNAALSNMAQGLCMFDEQDQLIICNQRYLDLYHLPEEFAAPGTPLLRIVRRLEGVAEDTDLPDQHLRDLLAMADIKRDHNEVELPDGSTVEVQCRVLGDGSWVATHEDVTEKRRADHQITYLASHDPLTDLPNRSFFREQLQRSLAVAERGHGFALHSLDLDRFKDVNDTFGHGTGDELLKQVASRLRLLVREGDFVTRLGGDEFAILQFPLDGPDDASALAARVVKALGEPFQIQGHEILIGATVGIAMAPGDTRDAADLMQKSDLALYRAKADGRNTYRFFEAGMDAAQRARHALENELRIAIRKGEFELHYQPILDVQSKAISSFEALIRWRHPTRGLIEPAAFIPTAEDTGLILPIGEWVLREACREAAGWPSDIKVAVNLSPVQFKNRNLIALVKSALSATGLAAERLELEITESVLLQDSDSILIILQEMRDLGVGIAMDDFGTGYSSLSYLRSFPFSRIKIDRSFIADLTSEGDSHAIIQATVGLSGKLGMTSTAEGVETLEQLDILRKEGCTHIQGYFISPAIPAADVAAMLLLHPGGAPPVEQREVERERRGAA